MANVYFIGHHDDDGNNFDLLVEAETTEEAVSLWQNNYWPIEEGYTEEGDQPDPEKVYFVNLTGKSGVIPWDLIKEA